MKIEEMRKKSEEELQKELLASRKELFSLRVQAASGEAANAKSYKVAKKRIAQIKTILTEKRMK
jgi:large subunit ribosomal protein L29